MCSHNEQVIKESLKIFLENGLNCYVYVQNNNLKLEQKLLNMGFTVLDTMLVLKNDFKKTNYDQDDYNGIHISTIDICSLPVWIDVFCRSFDVSNWKSEIERIMRTHFEELTLLVSYIDNNHSRIPVGCTALFNKYNLMGLYCLGTISRFRGKGLAMKMIRVCLDIAQRENCGFLFLQTFAKEGFISLYKKMDFQIIYQKKIYAFNKQ
jgi:GNAT superfamily N-acetyltransferase